MVVSAIFLISYFATLENRGDIYEEMQKRNEKLVEELEEKAESVDDTNKVVIPIDFKSIKKDNEDIYAWIKIPGTKVDYPILQNKLDDDYYLNHTVEGKEGLPGSIYTESLNNIDFTDRNTVIYGHDMMDGSMFGDLSRYLASDYMEKHSKLLIYTLEHIYTYKIFAAVTYDDRHLLHNFDFSREKGLSDFLESISKVRNMHSYINDKISVSSTDRIVTLSTCTGNEEQRLLVEAVLIDEK